MNFQNPIHQTFYNKVVLPAMNTRASDVEGVVFASNYEDQTVDVYWQNPVTLAEKFAYNLPLPKDGDGIFRQAVKNGDKVKIAFRNGNYTDPYISVVEKSNGNKIDNYAKFGSSIPKGMSFL